MAGAILRDPLVRKRLRDVIYALCDAAFGVELGWMRGGGFCHRCWLNAFSSWDFLGTDLNDVFATDDIL